MLTDLRAKLRAQRRALTQAQVSQTSKRICQKIITSDYFLKSEHIAYYLPDENEIDLSLMAETALSQHKKLYLPVFSPPYFLDFYRVDRSTVFQKNQFGILEPKIEKAEKISLNQLELMFIPLVAFDEAGHRMGRGLGCYDRYLESPHHCQLIGVAYDFQRVAHITPHAWDVKMDRVVF